MFQRRRSVHVSLFFGRRTLSGTVLILFFALARKLLSISFQLVQMRIQDNATMTTQISSGMPPLVMRERAMSASQRVESPPAAPPIYGFFPRTLAARPPPTHRHSSEGGNNYLPPNSDRRSPPRLSDPDASHALVDLRVPDLRRPHSVAAPDSPFPPLPDEDEVFRSPPTPPQHAYINVMPIASPTKSTVSAFTESTDASARGVIHTQARSASEGSTSTPTPTYQPDKNPYVNLQEVIKNSGETTPPLLDYAFVNLGTPGPCSSPAATCARSAGFSTASFPSGKHEGTPATHNYAHIDLEKTKALEQTANGRRHRHDSSATASVISSGLRDVC